MDTNKLQEALISNPAAQELAVAEAAREAIRRMSPEEQAEALLRAADTQVTIANPRASRPLPPREPPAQMHIYAANTLYGKQIEATPMIVRDMIPVGLTVLAGQPKRGKSWLALALGLCVTQGRPFLGHEVRRGAVLYLDIESREYRVQARLERLQPEAWPKDLYITHDSPPIGAAFYQQLEDAIAKYGVCLIIIDTLGRVKSGSRAARKGENAYEADTGMFGEMQKWAQVHRVAVLAIHHMRKTSARNDDEDWYERINGSNGLAGAADAVIGLGGKRGDPVSTLYVSGRDIEGEYRLCIRFEGGMWTLEGTGDPEEYAAERAYNTSEAVRGIIALMRIRAQWQGTATELLDEIVAVTRRPVDLTAKVLEGEIELNKQRLYQRTGITVGWRRPNGGRRVISIIDTRSDARQVQMEIGDESEAGG